MKSQEFSLQKFKHDVDFYQQLVSAIAGAPSYWPTKDDLRILVLIIRELKQMRKVYTRTSITRMTQRIVAMAELFFDGGIQTAGWLIYVLRESHGPLPSDKLRNRWTAIPKAIRLGLMHRVEVGLKVLAIRATNIAAMTDVELQKEISLLQSLDDGTCDDYDRYVNTVKFWRSYKMSLLELEMLRESFAKHRAIASPPRGMSDNRPKQSANLKRGTVYLIDKIEDHLHKKVYLYRTSAIYLTTANHFRDMLCDADSCDYVQHKTSSSDEQVLKYIIRLVKSKEKLVKLYGEELVADFYAQLESLKLKMEIGIEYSNLKGLSGQEPGKIMRGRIVFDLRLWWIDTTGDTSRVTFSGGTGTYSGKFYEFVAGELKLVGLMVDGSNLQPLIKEVCDVVDPLYFALHKGG